LNAANTNCHFVVNDFGVVKKKMLNWADRFSIFCFLDNHGYPSQHHSLECLLAAGVKKRFTADTGNALPALQKYLETNPGWQFGHLAYDLKNEIESLTSAHPDHTGYPGVFFFEPECIIRLAKNESAGWRMEIEVEQTADAAGIFREIMQVEIADSIPAQRNFQIQQRVSRKEYVQTIEQLRKHILRGDCYEINYCMEFFAGQAVIDPLTVFQKLSAASPNPFSALYKLDDKFLICASPERFLKKTGNKIFSQPIKGTSKRFLQDAEKDEKSRQSLFENRKDRSENVMVVDLVRNDLARVCKEGSVQVDELFGIYSFPQVHQMISTVSGELQEDISFTEIIRATFPMGSMTGAPKRKVMELIERYEKSRRGIFSGAVGYITPPGDFDFNVVIRSIMYNAAEKYLSYQAGSGITFYCDAEKEYEECLLKAEAMKLSLMS
jgi:para-aminobenzoate synthetase component 1